MSIYPKNWPRCPNCGAPALDGHITCGSWECNEHAHRRGERGWTCSCGFYNTRADCTYACQVCGGFR